MTAQAKEISSLKRRVKRLKKKRSGTHRLTRLYKVGLSARVESSAKEQSLGEEDASKKGRNIDGIDVDAEITLVDETVEDQGRFDHQEMFDTSVLDDEEEVSTVAPITTAYVTPDEITMAQALVEIKKSKPKGNKVVIEQEPEQGATTTTTTVTIPTLDSTRPKPRGVVMQEPSETPTTTTIPISSKVQDKGKGIMVEEPLKMKKKEQISFDEQEARRLQAEIDVQDRLAEEKAQLIEDENLPWDNVQAMMDADYELAVRRAEKKTSNQSSKEESNIDLFVPMDSEVVKDKAVLTQESSSKRADDEDDVTIDATPLSIKTPVINYKIYKEGKKSYFQIFRADGNSQMYYTFSKMLKNFDKENLEVLWRLVKDRFKKNTIYYLLVEKMYPLTNHTLHQMFNNVKLQVDEECEMAYVLLRLVKKQLKEGYKAN
nr:hypothetical protein [Tanacetum cinerariifolium]